MDIFIISFVFWYFSVLYTAVLTQKITGTSFNSSFEAINSLRQNGQNNAVAIQNIIETAIPGVSFPQYSTIPRTSFNCSRIQHNGFYADVETGCQVYRRCRGPRMQSYLCPNRTLFNQITLTCDWWYNVNCSRSQPFYMFSNVRLYNGNERFLDDSGYQSSAGKWQTNQGSRPFTIRTRSSATTSSISSKAKFTTEAATFASTSRAATLTPLHGGLNASFVGSVSSTAHPTVATITATNRQAPLEPGIGDLVPMAPLSATTNFTAASPERTTTQITAVSLAGSGQLDRLDPGRGNDVPVTPPSAANRPTTNVTTGFSERTITNSTVTYTTGINGPARLEPGSIEPVPMIPPSAIANATADSSERTITQITLVSTNGSSQLALLDPGSGTDVTITPPSATINVTASFLERPTTGIAPVSSTGSSQLAHLDPVSANNVTEAPPSAPDSVITPGFPDRPITRPITHRPITITAVSLTGSNRLARLDPGIENLVPMTPPIVTLTNVTEFPQWLITANNTESNSSNREVLIDFAGRPGTIPVRQTLVAELRSGHTSAGMNGLAVTTGNIPFRQGRKIPELFPFLDHLSVPYTNADKASDKDMEFYINRERYGLKKYLRHQLMIPFALHGNSNVTTANKVQMTPASFRQLRKITQ